MDGCYYFGLLRRNVPRKCKFTLQSLQLASSMLCDLTAVKIILKIMVSQFLGKSSSWPIQMYNAFYSKQTGKV